MEGKKYLLVADLPTQRERVEEVAFAFMRAAYLTDSILFIMVDLKKDAFDTYRYLSRNAFFGSVKIQLVLKNQLPPEQIVNQVDYYIIGNHPDEIFYVDAAIRHGVEIIGKIVASENIFSGVEVNPEIQQFKENLHALVAKDLLEKFPPEQFEYFLFHEGMGDSVAVFFWLKEYRKLHDKKILILCVNPLREEIMRTCPYAEEVIRISPQVFDFLSIYYAEEYDIVKVLTAPYSDRVVNASKKFPLDRLYNCFLPEVFRDFLGIPTSVEFKKYPVSIPESSVARAKELFSQMNLTRGKTVFIVTEGLCFNGLEHHNDFWLKLVRRLQVEGYDVVFNGQNKFFSNCKSVFLSFFESSAFVGLCGHVVSSPTGFVETICAFNTVDSINLQIIYPGGRDEYYRRQNVIGRLDAMGNIIYYGSGFAAERAKNCESYIKNYLDANISFNVHVWGDTAAEDDALIEKIVSKIIFN
ncbi:MAG: hypothetical protein J5809_06060 [Selenomonadaceae bacterium]|nr:hypothetical protein [Selenomonadaceae bacterium]